MLNTNTQGQEDRVTGQVTKKSTQRNEVEKTGLQRSHSYTT